jgi:hypothetical protein
MIFRCHSFHLFSSAVQDQMKCTLVWYRQCVFLCCTIAPVTCLYSRSREGLKAATEQPIGAPLSGLISCLFVPRKQIVRCLRRMLCKTFEVQSRGQLHRKMLRLDFKLSNGGLPLPLSQVDVAKGASSSSHYRPSTCMSWMPLHWSSLPQ